MRSALWKRPDGLAYASAASLPVHARRHGQVTTVVPTDASAASLRSGR